MVGNESQRAVVEQQIGVDEAVVGRHPAFIVVPPPLAAGIRQPLALVPHAGRNGDHAVFDVAVQRIGRRTVGSNERFVEPAFVRPVDQRCALFVIDQQRVFEATTQLLAVFIEPCQPDVPLAEHPRAVSLFLQHTAQRRLSRAR